MVTAQNCAMTSKQLQHKFKYARRHRSESVNIVYTYQAFILLFHKAPQPPSLIISLSVHLSLFLWYPIPFSQLVVFPCGLEMLICQPVLTYGMECMSNSKDQFRRMESIQGRLIKQCLGLSKRSHNSAVLKALKIDKAQNIVNRNVLNLYHRIFKIDSPARSLMQFLLARYITYGTTVPGTLLDRVVSIGESPLKCVFRKCGHTFFI